MGYTATELEDVQALWNLRFPPDLVEMLREHRPLMDGSFDWIDTDPAEIQAWLDWPFESFWFDVEHASVWWSEWGDKPARQPEQRERLREVFNEANAPLASDQTDPVLV